MEAMAVHDNCDVVTAAATGVYWFTHMHWLRSDTRTALTRYVMFEGGTTVDAARDKDLRQMTWTLQSS